MSWQDQLNGDSLSWLLEVETTGVRYLALRDLLDVPVDDPQMLNAQQEAYQRGPIATILDAMQSPGYWVRPSPGYNPKYRSAVWSLMSLGQLGALAVFDERIQRACAYLLDHALAPGGQFSMTGAPSGTIDCLQGNLCWALLTLGYDDPRLESAFEWMARSVTGEGVAANTEVDAPVRYYAYQCGPRFACGVNRRLPCAWGGTKVMLAFSRLPAERRTPLIQGAIQEGIDFIFSVDPATARYPVGNTGNGGRPSRNWWKFGFPVFYITDILQIAEALVGLGYGADPRLANTLELIRQKQDDQGRWALEYDYAGKTWADYGDPKQPNPWVTLRALRVLKAVG